MKIVFFGTPDYVLPILRQLYKSFRDKNEKLPIAAVVTQQPKPVGRSQSLEYSPVDKWAHKKNIPIFFESKELVDQNVQADVGILAAYGRIIPNEVLNYFPHGILNIHPSLLPKYRGATPVRSSIVAGNTKTGLTIIKLDNKLDHGPIIAQYKEDVLTKDTAETLRNRLFAKSAEILTTLLPAYVSGKINPREQDHKQASFTSEVKKTDALIPSKYLEAALQGKTIKDDWDIAFIKDFTIHPTPESIFNFIRSMEPWPTAWTQVELNSKIKNQKSKRLKILKAHIENSKLVLDEVQLEGKNPVSWKQFMQGYPKAKLL